MSSCSKIGIDKVTKLIENEQIDIVEKLVADGKVSDIDEVKRLIFENIKSKLIFAAKNNDQEYIKNIFNTKSFSQKEYDEICEEMYKIFNSYKPILDLINTKLPPDTFCGRNTLLQCAVIEQDLDSVQSLLLKGASCSIRDKLNKYNALLLSIRFHSVNSIKIFESLLDKTQIREEIFFYDDSSGIQTWVNGWYFESLINFDQKEMMNMFLKKPQARSLVLEGKDTLRILTSSSNYKDVVPPDIVDYDLVIERDYDYFENAIKLYNINIINELIKKNVCPIIHGKSYILDIIYAKNNIDKELEMVALDPNHANYPKLLVLAPTLEEYINSWLNEKIKILNGKLYCNDKIYASFGEAESSVTKRIGEPYGYDEYPGGKCCNYKYHDLSIDFTGYVSQFRLYLSKDGVITDVQVENMHFNYDKTYLQVCDILKENNISFRVEEKKGFHNIKAELTNGNVLWISFLENDLKTSSIQYWKN